MKQDLLAEKKDLNAQELMLLEAEFGKRKKSPTALWLLWLFTGTAGGHRYYLGDWGRAIAQTVVFGVGLILAGAYSAHVMESATTIEDVVIQTNFGTLQALAIPALWALVDAFFIGRRLAYKNTQAELEVIHRIKNSRSSSTAP